MMVQYGLRHHAYLDVAKYYRKVWETSSIQEDVQGKGKTVRGDSIVSTSQPDVSLRLLSTLFTMSHSPPTTTNNQT